MKVTVFKEKSYSDRSIADAQADLDSGQNGSVGGKNASANMQAATRLHGRAVARSAAVGTLALLMAACSTTGDSDVYRPGTIHVEAQQEELHENLDVAEGEIRQLRDRFNALERLYVDLIRVSKDQQDELALIRSRLKMETDEQTNRIQLQKLSSEMKDLSGELSRIEKRLFSVEVASDGTTPMSDSDAMMADTMKDKDGAMMKDGAMADKMEAPSDDTAHADGEAMMADKMPTGTAKATEFKTSFGVHLGSFRSRDQIPGSWSAFQRVFGEELGSLEAVVAVQNQEGIGEFLRLIAGPVASEEDAESICTAIKVRAREQFCVATSFQGDPL